MSFVSFVVKGKGEEQELEGLTLVIRHLALEGDKKTQIFLVTKNTNEDGKEEEEKVLLATLSPACPQHALEVPVIAEKLQFVCDDGASVHVIATIEPDDDEFDEDDMEDLDDEDMEGMEDDEEEEDEEVPEPPKKEEKKPQPPKKEEKKPQQQQQNNNKKNNKKHGKKH